MRITIAIATALATAGLISGAAAQTGPVATSCKADIATYCAGKSHANREVRTCLEANKAKVSAACKTALDTTGPGKGGGKGKGKQ